jgi:uncharacterized protein
MDVMPASSLLALIDDIASTLDDVAAMTKVATKKTAGVLGDDLALNAEQVTGVEADRELPIVWAVAKGSCINKLILIPIALLLSELAPPLIQPLLLIGGLFLCYEGFEKVAEKFQERFSKRPAIQPAPAKTPKSPTPDSLIHENASSANHADYAAHQATMEAEKVRGAVRTDFILSAEILVISLGTVADQPLLQRSLVLIGIGVIMTVGVYGLVAGIVKLDDLGLYWSRKRNPWKTLGHGLVRYTPYLMRTLGVLGTAAMFLVGGGIVTHTFHMAIDPQILTDFLVGLAAGGVCAAAVLLARRLRSAI